MKRIIEELKDIQMSDNSDVYCIDYDEEDLTKFYVLIKGASDSLYKHKFIKLQITIPENYPFSPPKAKHIQYSGERIHPNLYVEGKVCLSIINTWNGPSWNPVMKLDTVFRTIQSILDNNPYLHEPDQKDNVAYNKWVEYHSWQVLLKDHLEKELRPKLIDYMKEYLNNNKEDIKKILEGKQNETIVSTVYNQYTRNSTTKNLDWDKVRNDIYKILESVF